MEIWQKTFLFLFAGVGLCGAYIGYKKSRYEDKRIALAFQFLPYGAFVWADVVVFGIFWALFSIVSIFLNDWILFLLGYSLFWSIRSFGETIYWFNQQFSNIKRSSHTDFFFSRFFAHDEYTLWFVMQIIMQCVAVVSVIMSIYFGKLWLNSF